MTLESRNAIFIYLYTNVLSKIDIKLSSWTNPASWLPCKIDDDEKKIIDINWTSARVKLTLSPSHRIGALSSRVHFRSWNSVICYKNRKRYVEIIRDKNHLNLFNIYNDIALNSTYFRNIPQLYKVIKVGNLELQSILHKVKPSAVISTSAELYFTFILLVN